MLRVTGFGVVEDQAVDVRFSESQSWDAPPGYGGLGAGPSLDMAAVSLGDPLVGPNLYLFNYPFDFCPLADAHMHASDNWRIVLRGSLFMGRSEYKPEEFRFNNGWQAYAGDSLAAGPEGGWCMIFMADRRGTRIRTVKPELSDFMDETVKESPTVARWAGIEVGDVYDLDTTSGDACIVTTLGSMGRGHLNGSFAQMDEWVRDEGGYAVVAAAMGDPERGPLVVLSSTPAGRPLSAPSLAGTETLRVTIKGSWSLGEKTYEMGDLHVEPAAHARAQGIAGDLGAYEVVIYGDRRPVFESLADDGWSSAAREALLRVKDDLHAVVGV